MATLYTFGDSFTAGVGCKPGDEYYEKYNKNNELIWPELVAKHYNIELINAGVGGCSNEIIIDNIIRYWNRIKPQDIVIISKTFSHRFDIPSHRNKKEFTSVWGPSWFNNKIFSDWPDLNILKSYLLLFRVDVNLYDIRHSNYLNFFRNQLQDIKDVTTLYWDVEKNIGNFERITEVTNGEIIDGHFSYQGHSDFANWVINKIEVAKKTKYTKTNWI